MNKEINRIKDLIVKGEYEEARNSILLMNSKYENLSIERFINFNLDQACKILGMQKISLGEHNSMGFLKANDQTNKNGRCLIALEYLLEFSRYR